MRKYSSQNIPQSIRQKVDAIGNLSLQLRADGSQKANTAGSGHVRAQRKSRQGRHGPRRLAKSGTKHLSSSVPKPRSKQPFLKNASINTNNRLKIP